MLQIEFVQVNNAKRKLATQQNSYYAIEIEFNFYFMLVSSDIFEVSHGCLKNKKHKKEKEEKKVVNSREMLKKPFVSLTHFF